MLANVTIFCFFASYLVAFVLELSRLVGRSQISRLFMVGFGVAGFVAHSAYLLNRSQQSHLPPLLSSIHDWLLVLAWLLVLLYLFLTFVQPDLAWGVFTLPVVLTLVASIYLIAPEPSSLVNAERARRSWGMLHASLLVFGMGCVAGGFVSGLMYLVQHRRLKTGYAVHSGLSMPSLERLAQINRWSVGLSFLLLTLGFGSGVYLGLLSRKENSFQFTDPFVLAGGGLWLLLTGLFIWMFRQRRPKGKQIAWMTMCAFGFLLITVVVLQVLSGSHLLGIETWHTSLPGRNRVWAG